MLAELLAELLAEELAEELAELLAEELADELAELLGEEPPEPEEPQPPSTIEPAATASQNRWVLTAPVSMRSITPCVPHGVLGSKKSRRKRPRRAGAT
jgi:hypothetical protein